MIRRRLFFTAALATSVGVAACGGNGLTTPHVTPTPRAAGVYTYDHSTLRSHHILPTTVSKLSPETFAWSVDPPATPQVMRETQPHNVHFQYDLSSIALTATGERFYTRDGTTIVCTFHEVVFKLPLRVGAAWTSVRACDQFTTTSQWRVTGLAQDLVGSRGVTSFVLSVTRRTTVSGTQTGGVYKAVVHVEPTHLITTYQKATEAGGRHEVLRLQSLTPI